MRCDSERLRETLGRPELARLVQRLRSRVERGKPLTGVLALNDATPAERDGIDRLLGRVPTQGAALAIPIARLETKLRAAGICPDLRSALEELGGALVDRKAERESIERQWADLFVLGQTRIQARPELASWLEQVRGTGLLRRYELGDAHRLLFHALDVADALPASNIPLAELAAAVVGDAHALDPGTSLGSLVLRAAATLGKCERFDDAQSRRETWAAVGVICDELSAPVLVLNLPVAENKTVSDRMLALCGAVGEPVHLTVRQLLGAPPSFAASRTAPAVYVCENPSIVAAAARRLGAASAPVVCIDGQPRTATRLLLDALRAAGVRLLYHGDFDWPGIQIANTILQRHGAEPWRMSAADYRAAANGALELTGAPVPASWDIELTTAMEVVGKSVHEEQVCETLLGDLENPAQRRGFR